jgi:subtilisin family serine protease
MLPFISNVEKDYSNHNIFYSVPNDPSITSSINDQYYFEKIKAFDCWNIETGKKEVRVGILDSGINNKHEELINGNVSTIIGKDCFPNRNNFNNDGYKPYGHGTRVASIIGANTNNNRGISGLCWNITLCSLRLDDPNNRNQETVSTLIEGINYAAANNIKILNYSSGIENNDSNILKNVVKSFDGLIIQAAGNYYIDLDKDSFKIYPACWNLPNVIVVGGTDSSDNLALYNSPIYPGSDWGSNTVDIMAPSVDLYLPDLLSNNSYSKDSGTSFAAPQVTAAAALIKSHYPNANWLDIKNAIINNVDYIESLNGRCKTSGRLNLYKCLSNPINHCHNYKCEYYSTTKHKYICSSCNKVKYEVHFWDRKETTVENGKTYGNCSKCNEMFPINSFIIHGGNDYE